MQLEIEQKYPVDDLRQTRQALEALGARFEPEVEQADVYFRHPLRDFAKTDEALRLRKVGEENCITYKGPKIDTETKTRREIELPLDSGQQTLQEWISLLEILGFGQVLTVSKRRTPGKIEWAGGEIHLALDEVAGLGTFIELEILADEQELGLAKQRVLSLARKLEFQAPERRGYLDLLLQKSQP